MESEGERHVIMVAREQGNEAGWQSGGEKEEREEVNAHRKVARSGLTKAVRRRAPDGRHLEGRQTCAKSCTARSGP